MTFVLLDRRFGENRVEGMLAFKRFLTFCPSSEPTTPPIVVRISSIFRCFILVVRTIQGATQGRALTASLVGIVVKARSPTPSPGRASKAKQAPSSQGTVRYRQTFLTPANGSSPLEAAAPALGKSASVLSAGSNGSLMGMFARPPPLPRLASNPSQDFGGSQSFGTPLSMASQDWLMGTQQHVALEAITSPPAPVKKRRGPSSGDDISELTSFTQRGTRN